MVAAVLEPHSSDSRLGSRSGWRRGNKSGGGVGWTAFGRGGGRGGGVGWGDEAWGAAVTPRPLAPACLIAPENGSGPKLRSGSYLCLHHFSFWAMKLKIPSQRPNGVL